MRTRTLHTSVNLLVEPELYQRLKVKSKLKNISMSQIIRQGIRLRLDQMDRENPNAIIIGGKL
jgi:post-segregation antitoxin (ccd killing protein)